MRIATIITVTMLSGAFLRGADSSSKLENKSIAFRWSVADGKLQPAGVDDKLNGGSITLGGECFRVELGDGTVLKSSDFKLASAPVIEPLAPQKDSPTTALHEPGRQLVAKFLAPGKNLSAEWRVMLRSDSTYVREQLSLKAGDEDVLVKEITLLDEKVPGAKVEGTVDGSPVGSAP